MPAERDEHLAWCKMRALEYLDLGDAECAVQSMLLDMEQHPEGGVNAFVALAGAAIAARGNLVGARRWIEGFR